MDPFSHILWSVIVFKGAKVVNYRKVSQSSQKNISVLSNKAPIFWVMFFGIFPDLLSGIPFLIWKLFYFNFNLDIVFGGWLELTPPAIFAAFQTAYNLFHSILVFGAVLILLFIFNKRKIWLPILAWGLHIFIDIFSHAGPSHGIRIFYPFSDFYFNFVNWDTVPFMIVNTIVLGIIGLILVIRKLSSEA